MKLNQLKYIQGKGKKRAVGWFPASYVKLLAGGEANSAADTSVASSNGSGQLKSEKMWHFIV